MSGEESSLGEATLRLSTDGNGLRLGIEEAHVAALGLQKNLDNAHSHIKEKFAEKFQHIGVHTFGHQLLGMAGISGQVSPLLNTLGLGVKTLAASFGIASGPIGLVVMGLAAIAAIGFRVYEAHEKQVEKLAELSKKQDEAFKTTHELRVKLDEYRASVTHTAPELDRLYDATKRLDDLQRGNMAGTAAQAIGMAHKKLAADREEIANLEELRKQRLKLTQSGETGFVLGRDIKAANDLGIKIRELTTDMAAQNQIIVKGTADLKARAGGYMDAAEKATKLKEAAVKLSEEEKKASEERKKQLAVAVAEGNQFTEFQAKSAAKIMQIQEAEGAGKISSVKKTYDRMRAETTIAFNHERSLINASTANQRTKDSRIAQLHATSERTMTAISAAETAKRKAMLAGYLNTSTGMYSSMGQVAISATNMIVDTAAQGFAVMLVQGKSLTEAFKGFFENMATAIIAEIMKMIAKQLILLALETMTGTLGGGGGAVGSATKFAGFAAKGGPVNGGDTYMVGEDGPELFTPPQSGVIIPNNKLGRGSSGGGVVVNQQFSLTGIDLGSADAARKLLRAAAAQMRSGATDALAFARATTQQDTLQSGRAYG